jgi:aminomethyltransferase
VAAALLAQPEVAPAGLGARDTLRLEAGLCLYGHDIDSSTTPIEAGLQWALQKVRRAGGARHGGYPGAAIIDAQIAQGSTRRRVGLAGIDRVPVRGGAELLDETGNPVGKVTSGTWAPGVERVIAMGYVSKAHSTVGSQVFAVVRGKPQPMVVTGLPFAPHRYVRV